jgi:hypothetical protein
MKFHQTEDFKRLQSKWYKKLAKEGFSDIENEKDLKVLHSTWFHARHKEKNIHETHNAKREYFRLAGIFLHVHEFASDLEKTIWELHTDGFYLREIATKLRTKQNKVNKDNVRLTLQKLTQAMFDMTDELEESSYP